MKLKFLFLQCLSLACFALSLQAQKTCISGDCYNGYGIALKQNGDTIISDFVNGKVTNQVLVASKNHHVYRLSSVGDVRWYLEKSGDSLRIGQGAAVNQYFWRDTLKPVYFLSKKGDLLYEYDNRIIHFVSDGLIKAYQYSTKDKQNRFEISSNGADYVLYNFVKNIMQNGFVYIQKTNEFIYFTVSDGKLQFFNELNKQQFQAKYNHINSFSLGGFDEYYFDNFEKQRSIEDLEEYINELKYSLFKPINEFNKIVDKASAAFGKIDQNLQAEKEKNAKNPIALTFDAWRELLTNEIIIVCQTEYKKEYKDFLFNEELTGLPSKDDELVYNLKRDANNLIIGLDDYSTNNTLSFLVPAFKKALSNLLSQNSYKVPSAISNFFDLKTMKRYDFKIKLNK